MITRSEADKLAKVRDQPVIAKHLDNIDKAIRERWTGALIQVDTGVMTVPAHIQKEVIRTMTECGWKCTHTAGGSDQRDNSSWHGHWSIQ